MTEPPRWVHPRPRGYDYNWSGVYFLTLCTQNRLPILNEIVGRGIPNAPLTQSSETGRRVQDATDYLVGHGAQIQTAASVIMPNHVHILLCVRGEGNGVLGMPCPIGMRTPGLVSPLKCYINRVCGRPLWQASYHDHIIRDENDFLNHWSYIKHNPTRWVEDEHHV